MHFVVLIHLCHQIAVLTIERILELQSCSIALNVLVLALISVHSLDIAKYAEPVDPMFGSYAGKHRFSCIIVFMFSILHFRTSKMFYSRFYMFDMFKAQCS